MRANRRRQIIEEDDEDACSDRCAASDPNENSNTSAQEELPDVAPQPALLASYSKSFAESSTCLPGMLHERSITGHIARSTKWRSWYWGKMRQVSSMLPLLHMRLGLPGVFHASPFFKVMLLRLLHLQEKERPTACFVCKPPLEVYPLIEGCIARLRCHRQAITLLSLGKRILSSHSHRAWTCLIHSSAAITPSVTVQSPLMMHIYCFPPGQTPHR